MMRSTIILISSFIIIIEPFDTFSQATAKLVANNIYECISQIPIDTEYEQLATKINDCFDTSMGQYKNVIASYLRTNSNSEGAWDTLIDEILFYAKYRDKHSFQLMNRLVNESESGTCKDSIDTEYENWDSTKVILSSNPINYKTGRFVPVVSFIPSSLLIRDSTKVYEVFPAIQDTFEFDIRWKGEYEYDLEYVNNRTVFTEYKPGDIFNVRISAISDSSVSFLINGYENLNWKVLKIELKKTD